MTDPIEIQMNPDGSFDLPGFHVVPYVAPVVADPQPSDPVATDPATTDTAPTQTLVADIDIIRVGDSFRVTGTLNYPDGSSTPVTAYSLSGFDKAIVSSPSSWSTVFKALAEGSTTITNANSGTRGKLAVTVLPADPNIPPHVPSDGSSTGSTDQSTPNGVYATTLAGLTLPLASAWSDTRPDYSAHAKVTLADGSVLTCDTASQAPDYVPYAGVWIYPYLNADGSRHPDLTMACYADCVHAVCNNWVDGKANYAGHHALTINGAVAEDADARYDFGTATAACRQGLPQIAPQRNWDAKMVPNYGKVTGGYKPWASKLAAADNGVNGRSLTTPANGMGNTGAQYSIGILHGAMVPWVVDGGDENWSVVRAIEDHAWCWPALLRDRVTGLPAIPCLPHCRDVSMLEDKLGDTWTDGGVTHVNPVTAKSASPLKPDNAHCPGFGIVAYLSTGSAHDLESVLFWAGYECNWANPAYRNYGDCISQGQVRGVAWQLRSKAYAAALCPTDHPLHDGLQTIMAANAAHFDAKYCATGAPYGNQFGIVGGEGSVTGSAAGMKYTLMSSWQQAFVAQVVGQIRSLGFAGWDRVQTFVDTYTAGRMGTGGDDAMWWTMAVFYRHAPRIMKSYTSEAVKPEEYVADWAALTRQTLTYAYIDETNTDPTTVGRYADQVGKTIDQADFGAGPGQPKGASGAPDNFWANFQPALAALGPEHPAWKLYAEKVLPTQDYTTQGQFNIVPRAA